MAPKATPPIERRPMTTKQARRQWQKKGCPTISSAEKKRLKRAAELEDRAQAIHDKEKRQKENAKKRKEREEREKDKRKRMGVEEEIKLPEGQLGLGQFFKTKTTRSGPAHQPVQEISDHEDTEEDQELYISRKEEVDIKKHSRHHADQNIKTIAKSLPKRAEEGIIQGAEAIPDNNLAAKDYHTEAKLPAVEISTSSLLRSSGRKRKQPKHTDLDDTNSTPAKRHSPARSPLADLDTNIWSPSKANASPPSAQQPARWNRKQPFFENYAAYKAFKSAPVSQQPKTDNTMRTAESMPSTALKRTLNRVDLDQVSVALEQTATRVETPMAKKPRLGSRSSQRLSQQAIPRSSPRFSSNSSSMLTTNLEEHGNRGVNESRPPPSSQRRLPPQITRSFIDDLPDEEFPEFVDLDDEANNADLNSVLPRRKVSSTTDSFGASLCGDDLLDLDTNATAMIEKGAMPIALPVPSLEEPRLPAMQHYSQQSKATSSQSFSCDFSSQDLALLEDEDTNGPAPPRLCEVQSTQGKAKPTTAKSISPSKVRSNDFLQTSSNLLSDDDFDFPGCTQGFAALADQDQHHDSPRMIALPKTTKKAEDRRPEERNQAMLPPPSRPMRAPARPVRRPVLPIVEEDEFDSCFKGSTQALLDL